MDQSLEEACREAADPATALPRLSELARDFPAVRSIIAGNPSTYEALLDWLRALEDPAVTEALSQRSLLEPAGVATAHEWPPTRLPVAAVAPVVTSRHRIVWLVAGAAALGLLALVAVLVVVLSGFRAIGGGAPILVGGPSDEQQIEQVLSVYFSALETYDCGLLESTTTASFRAQSNYECAAWHSQLGDATVTISSTTDSISVNGNTASAATHGLMEVRANPLAELQSVYVNWELGFEKVDGTWLIASGSVSQY